MNDVAAFLARAIAQGRGRFRADLALKGGRVFDLVTGELKTGDVAICDDRIVGTQAEYRGYTEIDVSGKIVVPGFIDTHLHVESSLTRSKTRPPFSARSARNRPRPCAMARARSAATSFIG